MQKSIKNYFRYFAPGEQESAWGFHVSAVGHWKVATGSKYPLSNHPGDYQFSWQRGRTLPALQLVAVRAGGGVIEWRDRKEVLRAGSVFLILPGVWHRYRPEERTGWTEDWFELRGSQVDAWIESGLFGGRVFSDTGADEAWGRFDELHRMASGKPLCPTGEMAGLAMSILAQVLFGAGHDTPSSEVRIRRLVSQAHERVAMGEGVGFVARSLGVSYPTLHRHFHRLLGLAPKEFAGKVRLARAEKLLLGRAHNIKEIAALLGFHSAAHFSAAFKKNHGVSPKSWCAARQ